MHVLNYSKGLVQTLCDDKRKTSVMPLLSKYLDAFAADRGRDFYHIAETVSRDGANVIWSRQDACEAKLKLDMAFVEVEIATPYITRSVQEVKMTFADKLAFVGQYV